jgi:hypothetical protein
VCAAEGSGRTRKDQGVRVAGRVAAARVRKWRVATEAAGAQESGPERWAEKGAGNGDVVEHPRQTPGHIVAEEWPISNIRLGGLAFNGIGAIGAVVARFVHTEEVTGSNPVSPTLSCRPS